MKTPTKVELFYDSTWNDITDDVYIRDPITITRGRTREGKRVAPSQLRLSISNRDHKYAPRNPESELYGKIGRNTPIRVLSYPNGLLLPGGSGNHASTPDTAALDITGDIDVRVELTIGTWETSSNTYIVSKYNTTGDQRSWGIRPANNGSGTLVFFWSPDGAAAPSETSDVPVPFTGRGAIRVTLDVNNGASNYTLRFYTSDSIDGEWTQFGDDETGSATTSIFNSTASLVISGRNEGTVDTFAGIVHAVEVRNGIGGTVVANPVFSDQDEGTTSFTDSAGRTWTVNGDAEIAPGTSRFVGEVESWPQRWTVEANDDGTRGDVWAPITAYGIMRRLGGVGSKAQVYSALHRANSKGSLASDLIAYWPMEDATSGDLSITIPTYDLVSHYVARPLQPTFQHFVLGGASWSSEAPPGGSASARLSSARILASPDLSVPSIPFPTVASQPLRIGLAFRFADQIPESPTAAGEFEATIIRIVNFDVAAEGWAVRLITSSTGTVFNINTFHLDSGGLVDETVTTAITLDVNEWHYLTFTMSSSGGGADTAYRTLIDDVVVHTGTGTGIAFADTINVRSLSVASDVPGLGHISHLSVWSGSSIPAEDAAYEAFTGHDGEQAHERIERICGEEGISVTIDGSDSAAMGPQGTLSTLDLLFESADADGGILYESRSAFGVEYKTHTNLYNQDASVTLDYAAGGEVAPPLEPTEDTDHVRNDVTVTRLKGGSYTVVQETGSLNVQEPIDDPQGVGRYPVDVTLNLETDDQTLQQAAWIKTLGTWDEPRYPAIPMDLTAMDADGKSSLIQDAVALDIGDRIVVENPPQWQGPDDVDQHVQGYTEKLASHRWTVVPNTTPAGPWQVGVLDTNRLDVPAAGTTISEDLTTTETDITVPSGVFSTTNEPYDVIVGGEVITVTSATSTVLTVTRSVNGVVKTHSNGDAIRIYQPLRLARGA